MTRGTLFYRLRTEPQTVLCVIALLAYGCPLPAIVKAFGFDERTVKSWWQRAGVQCRAVYEHVISSQQLDLQQVQADEIKVKLQGQSLWMAMAIMVSTRLWLGGVLGFQRDKALMRQLAACIRQMALCRPLLLAVDGWRAYIEAFQPPKRRGRPSKVLLALMGGGVNPPRLTVVLPRMLETEFSRKNSVSTIRNS